MGALECLALETKNGSTVIAGALSDLAEAVREVASALEKIADATGGQPVAA
jgi:hypothetical protein